MAAEFDGRPLGHGGRNQSGDLVALAGRDQGTEGVLPVEAGAEPELAERAGQCGDELVMHGGVHVEAVRGGAGGAAVAHLRDDRSLDGPGDIRPRQYEERGIAAQLHGAADDAVRGFVQQGAADLGGAGERQLAHGRVPEHRLDGGPGGNGGHQVDNAAWNAGAHEGVDDEGGGERCLASGLQHDRAARCERGSDLAGGHRRGEVPGGDEQRHPDGLVRDDDVLVAAR